jgi:hypothetical protein
MTLSFAVVNAAVKLFIACFRANVRHLARGTFYSIWATNNRATVSTATHLLLTWSITFGNCSVKEIRATVDCNTITTTNTINFNLARTRRTGTIVTYLRTTMTTDQLTITRATTRRNRIKTRNT